jgi:glucan 1,3-beta-glucosidase
MMSSSKDAMNDDDSSVLEPQATLTPAPAVGHHLPWRGVSLGGWLLLEPGTAHLLFDKYRGAKGEKLRCEWDLMRVMRKRGALAELTQHRESCISKRDFVQIRQMGLNAVRIPFGYWIIIGKTHQDPYHGAAWEYLDRAVQWAEETGLQVLLDLHGAPGGESGEAPCGRRRTTWKWDHWRFNTSLKVLRLVAERYRSSPAVTGLAVCNEPSPKVPTDVLCNFYKKAVEVIRKSGMEAERVTVVLPVFQRSLEPFVQFWDAELGSGSRDGISFEVHWYHCFENEWHGRTFAQHLRTVQERSHDLQKFPIVVGEWSLALGCGAYHGKNSKEEMRALFAHAQLAAYQEASHGWFFWNWMDQHSIDWDWQRASAEGYLPLTSEPLPLPDLPPLPSDLAPGEDTIRDPLEAVFDTPPTDPRIRRGDTVYLRAFNGRYLDVDGPHVRARWSDRGKWQQFVLCPFGCNVPSDDSSSLCDGDIVSLLAHNNCYLGVNGNQVSASWEVVDDACAFMVRTTGSSEELRHRSPVFLQSCTTSRVLAPNESDPTARDRLLARWEDFGKWQRFTIEKPLSTAVTPHRPRRRSSFPGQLPMDLSATPKRSSGCFPMSGTPRTGRRGSICHRTSVGFVQKRSSRARSAEPPPRNSSPGLAHRSLVRRRSSACSAWARAACSPALRRRSSLSSISAPATPASMRTPATAQPSVDYKQHEHTSLVPDVMVEVNAGAECAKTPKASPSTTPSKRGTSLAFEELSEVATPSRRRRLSAKSQDMFTFAHGTPTPKALHAIFEED